MTQENVLGAVRVWVQPALPVSDTTHQQTAPYYQFPWGTIGGGTINWNWYEETRLIPERSSETFGSMGSATFRLLRAQREENGLQVNGDPTALVRGSYICITTDTDVFNAANVRWWGWISRIDSTAVMGTSDRIGSVQALELGHLLDGTQLQGWMQSDVSGYPHPISTPPTANMSGFDALVIGNATKMFDTTLSSDQWVFTRLPANCGTAVQKMWSRWKLLRHICSYCIPKPRAGGGVSAWFPNIVVKCQDGSESSGADPTDLTKISGYLNDTTVPEVFDLRCLTLKGAIDMLLPEVRGLVWWITPVDASTWNLNIATNAESNEYGIPQNASLVTVTAPAEQLYNISYTADAMDDIDAIRVEGAPHQWGLTISYPDASLIKGWSTSHETDFYTAASAFPHYGDDRSKDLEHNAQIRQSGYLYDVFTRFTLDMTTQPNGNCLRRVNPGDGTDTNAVSLIPQVNWNGTTVTIDESQNRVPYLPATRFLRTIPWPEGVKTDGTETRPADQITQPRYHTPKLFRYDAHGATGEVWLDLLTRGLATFRPDDRSPSMLVEMSPPERLARGYWASHSAAASSINPDSAANCFDYKTVVLTVGMESDQRVLVQKIKPGFAAPILPSFGGSTPAEVLPPGVRRVLIIRSERLQFWAVPNNTILALVGKYPSIPDRINIAPGNAMYVPGSSAGYAVTRNDYPTAERIANMAAAFTFRNRTSARIVSAMPGYQPSWSVLGAMIAKVIEVVADNGPADRAEISTVCNTVVGSVERDWSIDHPSFTVQTQLPKMIGFAIGGTSPTGGGGVSVSMEGTAGTAIQSIKRDVRILQRDFQRVPLITARSPPISSFITILVDQGNTLTTGQDGVKHVSPITSVPSLYDPNVTSSFIDGIGRGTLFIDGVAQTGYVLIANDSAALPNALVSGDVVATPTTKSIQVGSTTDSVTVYISAFF